MELGKDYRITIKGVEYNLETLDVEGTVVGVLWDKDADRSRFGSRTFGSYVPAGFDLAVGGDLADGVEAVSDKARVFSRENPGRLAAEGDDIVLGECLGDSPKPEMPSLDEMLQVMLGDLAGLEDCGVCGCEYCLGEVDDIDDEDMRS